MKKSLRINSLFVVVAVLTLGISACETPPSEECAQYIECQNKYEEVYELDPTDLSAYEAGGSCWTSSQEGSDACSTACEASLAQIREVTAGDDLGTPAECEG